MSVDGGSVDMNKYTDKFDVALTVNRR